jgi:hypothetical protein
MEDSPNERRKLSHNALLDSAIRITKQLASSNDIMTRSLANRMFSDLTLLRRGMPNRRRNEGASAASSALPPKTRSDAICADNPEEATVQQRAAAAAKRVPTIQEWAKTPTVFDFFDNGDVDWRHAMSLQRMQTEQRIATHATVLCLHDTLEFDYGNHGMEGPDAQADEVRRMSVHPLYAITPLQEPLGVVETWMAPMAQQDKNQENIPWILGYERVAAIAATIPATRFVYMAERQSTLAAFIQRVQTLGTPVDWLLRADSDSAHPDDAQLWKHLGASEPLGETSFTTVSTDGLQEREVRQQVWAQRLEIPSGTSDRLWATCVLARDMDAPADSTPLEWRLITNRSAQDLASATELAAWQRAHSAIDIFAKVVKYACRLDPAPSDATELEAMLAWRTLLAWRIGLLTWRERTEVNTEAALCFAPDEIRGAYLLMKKSPPTEPTQLNEMLHMLVQLGAIAERKNDAEAKIHAIRLGLRRVMDAAALLQTLRIKQD